MIPGPKEIFGALDSRFPFATAYDWDNSGWQVVTSCDIQRCLVALDPTPDAVSRAIDWDAQLIVTHHPLYFPGISTIDPESLSGAITKALLTADIGLLASHTCADRHLDGISGALADELGLENQEILAPDEQETFYKLVTFVPDEYVEKVRSGLAAAGAGIIGNYEECSFSLAGSGTYRPLVGARPLIGSIGKLEQVNEHRLEMRVPENTVDRVLQALQSYHPYDEVAFDLFQTFGQGGALGLGVIGSFSEPMEAGAALELVKKVMRGVPLQVTGPEEGQVEIVVVVGGSASDLIPAAAGRDAHLFVGGDLKYHQLLEHTESMICVDPGHRATEYPGVERLAEVLKHAAVHEKWEIEFETFLEDPAINRIL